MSSNSFAAPGACMHCIDSVPQQRTDVCSILKADLIILQLLISLLDFKAQAEHTLWPTDYKSQGRADVYADNWLLMARENRQWGGIVSWGEKNRCLRDKNTKTTPMQIMQDWQARRKARNLWQQMGCSDGTSLHYGVFTSLTFEEEKRRKRKSEEGGGRGGPIVQKCLDYR